MNAKLERGLEYCYQTHKGLPSVSIFYLFVMYDEQLLLSPVKFGQLMSQGVEGP